MGDGAAGNGSGNQRRNKGWDNLKPCTKGEPSRNPAGRPKRPSLKRAYIAQLAAVDPSDKNGQRIIADAAAARALQIVLHGEERAAIAALKEIREATAGSKVRVAGGRAVSEFINARFNLYRDPVSVSAGDSGSNRITERNGSGGELRQASGQNGNGHEAGE